MAKLGLALGGGGARGWVHVGALYELQEMGIEPDIITGSSAGALVGALWLTGHIEQLKKEAKSLTLGKVFSITNFTLRQGGLMAPSEALESLQTPETNIDIQQLPKKYGAVATRLKDGKEVWLTEGSLIQAIEASTSIPGLFNPVLIDNDWHTDGSMTNPVPVTLAQELGADKVIAISLMSEELPPLQAHPFERISGIIPNPLNIFRSPEKQAPPPPPSAFTATMNSVLASQHQLTKARFQNENPNIVIEPDLSSIGILEFEKIEEGIKIGRQAIRAQREEILKLVGKKSPSTRVRRKSQPPNPS